MNQTLNLAANISLGLGDRIQCEDLAAISFINFFFCRVLIFARDQTTILNSLKPNYLSGGLLLC